MYLNYRPQFNSFVNINHLHALRDDASWRINREILMVIRRSSDLPLPFTGRHSLVIYSSCLSLTFVQLGHMPWLWSNRIFLQPFRNWVQVFPLSSTPTLAMQQSSMNRSNTVCSFWETYNRYYSNILCAQSADHSAISIFHI